MLSTFPKLQQHSAETNLPTDRDNFWSAWHQSIALTGWPVGTGTNHTQWIERANANAGAGAGAGARLIDGY